MTWHRRVRGDWKLIVPATQNEPNGRVELYNLSADPHETNNLAESLPERVAILQKSLDEWWRGDTPQRN